MLVLLWFKLSTADPTGAGHLAVPLAHPQSGRGCRPQPFGRRRPVKAAGPPVGSGPCSHRVVGIAPAVWASGALELAGGGPFDDGGSRDPRFDGGFTEAEPA